MSVESPEQLRGLKRAGRVVAETLRVLKSAVGPGVTTAELDRLAAETFARHGARSGPILTYEYPGFVCISVEDEVVHGVPGPRILRPGELVTLDVAAEVAGYHADAAVTVPVGHLDGPRRRLIAATRAALAAGIRAARPGATLRDVGAAIEREARRHRFTVLRELTGHGIGLAMHEDPIVFNWAAPMARTRLTPGLVFTIEPMLTSGGPGLVLGNDGWTVLTADRAPSAHQEHTIMVSASGRPVVLTAA
ncbi:MAG TPA: type I methionyl aminopeptidase [Solirubrobacteraceae bacterium]|nr:type I methionyl aminopeptidase [Solirubrobacteraceae bacterium]